MKHNFKNFKKEIVNLNTISLNDFNIKHDVFTSELHNFNSNSKSFLLDHKVNNNTVDFYINNVKIFSFVFPLTQIEEISIEKNNMINRLLKLNKEIYSSNKELHESIIDKYTPYFSKRFVESIKLDNNYYIEFVYIKTIENNNFLSIFKEMENYIKIKNHILSNETVAICKYKFNKTRENMDYSIENGNFILNLNNNIRIPCKIKEKIEIIYSVNKKDQCPFNIDNNYYEYGTYDGAFPSIVFEYILDSVELINNL